MLCHSRDKKDRSTDCRAESVCYQLTCDRCKDDKVTADYYGETARTAYMRGQDHLGGQKRNLEDNPLHKHDCNYHQGIKGTYSMRVLRTHKTPFTRQLQEATEIQMSKSNILLNSKSEYNGQRIPRVVIEVKDKVYTKE